LDKWKEDRSCKKINLLKRKTMVHDDFYFLDEEVNEDEDPKIDQEGDGGKENIDNETVDNCPEGIIESLKNDN